VFQYGGAFVKGKRPFHRKRSDFCMLGKLLGFSFIRGTFGLGGGGAGWIVFVWCGWVFVLLLVRFCVSWWITSGYFFL